MVALMVKIDVEFTGQVRAHVDPKIRSKYIWCILAYIFREKWKKSAPKKQCSSCSGTIRNIKKRFKPGFRVFKLLLEMRLYNSVGQRGAGLVFFLYSDFLTKFHFFYAYVRISQERLGLSRNDLNWVVRLRNCYSKCVYRTL